MALKKHLDNGVEGKGGMPKIKEGPLVVNWDEGTAATSLEGVKEMLARLERRARARRKRGRRWWWGVCDLLTRSSVGLLTRSSFVLFAVYPLFAHAPCICRPHHVVPVRLSILTFKLTHSHARDDNEAV